MKKLQLKIDDIHVTGFEVVARATAEAGTVIGADALTLRTRCDQATCETCSDTCLCRMG